jgi:putative alpha-1,2-mannosidase
MGGDPGCAIISGAYAFGARNFDAKAAFAAMERSASMRHGVTQYLSGELRGSEVLEYASGDFAIAKFAQGLGDDEKYRKYLKQSQTWKKMFDPKTGWIVGGEYAEGSNQSYTWMIPHNLDALIEMMGGRDKAVAKLDKMCDLGGRYPYESLRNEPMFGFVWTYTWAGRPWQSQQLLRQILRHLKKGLDGDDDMGSMSSWCVWNMLGLYPAIPGEGGFVISGPLFPKATLHWGDGNVLTITAQNAAFDAPYTQSLKVNGKTCTRAWVALDELKGRDATLEFVMGKEPNKEWASDLKDAPPSFDVAP